MTSRSRSGAARATELSIQEALRGYMQQAPLPFAITRGAEHTLAYANPAFYRLVGAVGDSLGAPIASALTAAEGQALIPVLDRAFRDSVNLVDQRIAGPSERARGWNVSVWPVIAGNGKAETLGIEIRESSQSDGALDLQRQIAEQMLLGALRERGFAEDAEAARRRATFLAEAGRQLAESVDQSSTLVSLTKLALPTLGAWCIVDILEEGDAIRRLGIYHPDPEKQKLAQELERGWTPGPTIRSERPRCCGNRERSPLPTMSRLCSPLLRAVRPTWKSCASSGLDLS